MAGIVGYGQLQDPRLDLVDSPIQRAPPIRGRGRRFPLGITL